MLCFLIVQKNHDRMGMLVVELYWQHAPETCRNFAELARRGYYNGKKKRKFSIKTLEIPKTAN